MSMKVYEESEIRSAISLERAIAAIEEAFAAYSTGRAAVPPVINLDIPDKQAEIHVKAGHIFGSKEYVVKIAAGFYKNPSIGLPVGSGLMMVLSAETGAPLALLLDNGYLTELRTAAAGAVAAKYLAPENIDQVAIVGAGVQGRFQLQALASVRNFRRVVIYDHHTKNVDRYLQDMKGKTGAELAPAASLEQAVRESRVIITSTPSRSPLVQAEWVQPGTHITAMGSDGPDKQELDAALLAKADRLIADSLAQCLRLGEIHHAVKAGLIRETDVDGELGEIVAGKAQGRQNDDEITICDLTGVGVQDAAIAALALKILSKAL